jgi:hypothetical protein
LGIDTVGSPEVWSSDGYADPDPEIGSWIGSVPDAAGSDLSLSLIGFGTQISLQLRGFREYPFPLCGDAAFSIAVA